MHYAIEYHHDSSPYMAVGSRKRTSAGQLLRIIEGMALLRVGQHEWLLPAGSYFWLGAHTLAAFTPLANCRYDGVRCSLRMDQPAHVGWVRPSALLTALLNSLQQWQRPQTWQGAYGQRLHLIADELMQCAIAPQGDEALQTHWQAFVSGHTTAPPLGQPTLGPQWQLLQAVRQLKGGRKASLVANESGYGDEAALGLACQRWLGLALDEL
ncbi:hypothetical protein [Aeromonas cavernicola]|uniref:AraC family transcriptional regulator n=1 Tax=Aeromonas cavernicola TaxID=1006623 RepID=A0A2H9U973_9GAMM|nr:hypothetical protein [Aeromonas cavernicola]PJG60562.1 hypothetical protein CUC53_00705 [Aeromonas cavernicola]